MEHRLEKNLPRQLSKDISNFLTKKRKIEEEEEGEEMQQFPSKLQKQGRCHLCPRSADKKVKTACTKCGNPACSVHRKEVCTNCF